jgi:hypothetical protein
MTKLLKITPLEDSDVLVDLMVETRSRKYPEHREQIRFKVIVNAPDKEEINIERAAYGSVRGRGGILAPVRV